MDYNQILVKYVGGFGRYQLVVVILLQIVRLPSVIHNMGYVFYAATPPHWCAFDRRTDLVNLTETDWKTFNLPSTIEDGQRVFSKCQIYRWTTSPNLTAAGIADVIRDVRNGTEFGDEYKSSCNRWEYDRKLHVQDSLVTQFNLVCDRAWMKSMIATVFVIGWMTGAPITGYASDKFGRRKVLIITITGTFAFGLTLPFINNYPAFLVIRLLLSACMNGMIATNYAISLELVGPRYRSCVSTAFMLNWAVGYAALAGVAALLRTQFTFMIAVAAPTVLCLVTALFVPETVPWLVAKGRQDEADKRIKRMAKVNRKKIPENLHVTVQQGVEKAKTSWVDVVKTPYIRKHSIILWMNWFVDILVFYAISWTGTDISDNLYMNVFLAGIIEIPAYLACVPLLQYLGRRFSMSSATFLSGLFMLASLAVPAKGPSMVGLTLMSKFFITVAFSIVFQYTMELYPTVTRATGFAISNLIARTGAIIAPFLPLLGGRAPSIICGSVALAVSLPTLLLPETLNRKLPTTVEEAEEFGKYFKWSEFFSIRKADEQGSYTSETKSVGENGVPVSKISVDVQPEKVDVLRL